MNYRYTAVVLSICGLAPVAMAQRAEVVLAITAHAGATNRAVVPGRPDLSFTNFSNMYRSGGNRWITVATVTGGGSTAMDQIVVTGQGMTAAVGAQEGVAEVGDLGELLNLSGLANPQINEAGQWAIAFAPAGSSAGLVVRWGGASYSTVARAGGSANALEPGVLFGNTFTSAGIMADGSVSFLNSGIAGTTAGTTTAAFTANGTGLAAANLATVPGNQLGGGSAVLGAIDTQASAVSMQVTPDGTKVLLLGTLAGTENTRVVLVNNQAVLQAGATLAGTADTVATITAAWLESNGVWFARGTAMPAGGGTATGFIVRSGAVIARIGQPITPGSAETWVTFVDFKGNNAGQYVVTGTTSAVNTSNSVLVLNGTSVVARAGDPVDLDNDGQFDDGLYLHSFRDRCFLGNDGFFYVGARLKDAPDTTSGLGANVSLIRIAVPRGCNSSDLAGLGGTPGGDGQLSPDDIITFLSAYFVGDLSIADIASLGGGAGADGQLTADDVIGFLAGFFAGCP